MPRRHAPISPLAIGLWCAMAVQEARAEPNAIPGGATPAPSEGVARTAAAAPSVTPPRAREARVPYPEGGQGRAQVELELVVESDGRVSNATLVRGEAPFSEAALAAAPLFRFEPARRGEQAVAARVRFVLQFEPPSLEPGAIESSAASGQASSALPSAVIPSAELSSADPPGSIEVNVQGTRKLGANTFSRAEVRAMPGAFGDAYRVIESLPSVTPGVSGAPYFYVRGAPPGNVGYFFDEIRLPALFHVFGGPGVLHSAWLDRIDFYPGPYPVEFGRFAGGIVAGQSAGPEQRLRGELSLRVTDSSAFIELPLADGRTSLSVAGRYSYAQPIVQLFAPDVNVGYWDYQARLTHELGQHDTLSLFAFGAKDSVSDLNDGRRRVLYAMEFQRFDLSYQHRFAGGSFKLGALAGIDRSSTENGDVSLRDALGALRARSELRFSDAWTLAFGAEGERNAYRVALDALEDAQRRADYLEQFPTRTEYAAGAYVDLAWRPERGVLVNAGLRSDVYVSRGDTALGLDPRLSAELELGGGVSITHGLGIAHQPPSGRLPLPGLTPALGAGLQTSLQNSTTLRLALPEAVSAAATLFQNATFKLSDSIGQSRLDNGDDSLGDYTRATGSARGFELLLKRALSERFGGYLAYSFSVARRALGRAEGPALFDRRHVLSGALSFTGGHGIRLGGRATYYTGIPADVYYLEAAAAPPRTPAYYRLDLRAEKRWALGASGASWGIVLEVLNSTLNREVLNQYCNAYVCKKDRLGPITVPSLGLEASF